MITKTLISKENAIKIVTTLATADDKVRGTLDWVKYVMVVEARKRRTSDRKMDWVEVGFGVPSYYTLKAHDFNMYYIVEDDKEYFMIDRQRYLLKRSVKELLSELF